MRTLPVQIVRFVDAHQPGWVECVFSDASGHQWTFVDKIPVFTEANWDAQGDYPLPGVIACEIVREWTDQHGRGRCIISTERPWGIEAKGGETQFEVFSDQISTHLAEQ